LILNIFKIPAPTSRVEDIVNEGFSTSPLPKSKSPSLTDNQNFLAFQPKEYRVWSQ